MRETRCLASTTGVRSHRSTVKPHSSLSQRIRAVICYINHSEKVIYEVPCCEIYRTDRGFGMTGITWGTTRADYNCSEMFYIGPVSPQSLEI